ncbi:MAG: dicarboxylate/amino acid:cation symporter [Spirochaetales bacterium]|nr:MAG: dicarboxylate/amino acid:cation symporter [Spirochaetales bacterium]
MRVWIRFFAGSVIGIVLGLYLPLGGGDVSQAMQVISGIVLNVGRYAVYPLVFFGLIIAIHELRVDRLTGKIFAQAAISIVVATAAMVVVGTLVVLFLSPRRIPPIYQEAIVPVLPAIPAMIQSVFPRNLFLLFAGDGSFLLPVVTAGILLGLVMYDEGPQVSPATDLIDSLARIAYRLNSWITEVVSVGLIAVAAFWIIRLRSVSDLQLFAPLILVVAGVAALFVLVGFPLLVFLLGDRYNPFAWLYGLIPPAFAAFFSGDSYFALGPLLRVTKENYGISREVATPVLSLTTLFAKAGSAMVVATAFITVLRSYTALEITFGQVMWIMGASFLLSFLLGSVPGSTVLVGLSVLAQLHGQGMEEIFLIVLPALPILTGIAVVADTMTGAVVAFLVAQWERKRRIVDVLDFI